METPWEVIGFEKVVSESGKVGMRLYGIRNLAGDGEGMEAGRLYFNPEYCKYTPVIGQKIIPVEGRYGINQIYVVG